MPGTIQVTVVEFTSSSSQPSANSLKVSMGKKHFQTWDKGDFSFSITKLGENLLVSLLDAEGNEIANADIQTMQIIEKGFWDDVFPMEGRDGGGGGNVHMKLRFFLTEEDRTRIRVMRESVIKKKHDRTSIGLQIDAVSSKVEEEASRKLKRRIVGSAIPNVTDMISQGASSPTVKLEVETKTTIPAEKPETQFPFSNARSDIEKKVVLKVEEDGLIHKQQNQEPLKKTPSLVRKMISAFESSKVQDPITLKKSASVPSRLNRIGKESLRDNQDSKVVIPPAEQSLRGHEDPITSTVSERGDVISNNSELSQAPNDVQSSVIPSPLVRHNFTEVPMEKIGLTDSKVVMPPAEQSSRGYEDLITTTISEQGDTISSNSELSQTQNDVESSVTPSPLVTEKDSHVRHNFTEVPMETIGLMDSNVVIPPAEQSLRGYEDLIITTGSERGDVISSNSELSQAQNDVESSVTPSPLIIEKDSHDIQDSRDVIPLAEQSSRGYEDLSITTVSEREDTISNNSELSQVPNDVESSVIPSPLIIEKDSHVRQNFTEVPMETIALTETATESGKTKEENFQVVQPNGSSLEQLNSQLDSSDEASTTVHIQVPSSNNKPNFLQNKEEDYFSSESSGMWIFPDNRRHLCITTAVKEETSIHGHDCQENPSVSEILEKGTKYKMSKDQTKSVDLDEPESGSSPDDSSNGLIGQVMKIVVVLGFGLLVLLTRQKEPRKKRRDENVNLLTIPDYIEERTLF